MKSGKDVRLQFKGNNKIAQILYVCRFVLFGSFEGAMVKKQESKYREKYLNIPRKRSLIQVEIESLGSKELKYLNFGKLSQVQRLNEAT